VPSTTHRSGYSQGELELYQKTKGPTSFVIEIDISKGENTPDLWEVSCRGNKNEDIAVMAGDHVTWRFHQTNNAKECRIIFNGGVSPFGVCKGAILCSPDSPTFTVGSGDGVGDYCYLIAVGATAKVAKDPRIIAPGPGTP
jgi:hypothetical protein